MPDYPGTPEDQLPTVSAALAPEHRRANTGKKQGAYLVLVVFLLKNRRLAADLDTRAQRADGVAVHRSEIVQQVTVAVTEMAGGMAGLLDTVCEHIQDLALAFELGFQQKQVQNIAQDLGVLRLALLGKDCRECLQTIADVGEFAAVYVQSCLRTGGKQRTDTGLQRGLITVTGVGYLPHQG